MRIILTLFLVIVISVLPVSGQAEDSELMPNSDNGNQAPKAITQEEIDTLFGPEPYLGPTSWLDSRQDKEKVGGQ